MSLNISLGEEKEHKWKKDIKMTQRLFTYNSIKKLLRCPTPYKTQGI